MLKQRDLWDFGFDIPEAEQQEYDGHRHTIKFQVQRKTDHPWLEVKQDDHTVLMCQSRVTLSVTLIVAVVSRVLIIWPYLLYRKLHKIT